MKTKFIPFTDKIKLQSNPDAVRILLDEVNRLEAIIKDYEIGIDILIEKTKSSNFKNPISL